MAVKDLSRLVRAQQEHCSILHRSGGRPAAGSPSGHAPECWTRIAVRDLRPGRAELVI